ncbi:GNAT family N-acetyltransferase [Streptomyces sp. B6B3]|uniref:GNAT family N-acetyltransferase n=1 Tax=Streptomyces sp. B6B3 TaxID=3153570 RepID=UPI00325F8F55
MAAPADRIRRDQAELRRWRAGDLDALVRAIDESREHLVPWMPWAADQDRRRTVEFLVRARHQWDTGQAFNYAITSGGALIGACGLMRRIGAGGLDIGYWLHPRWTGRGLATMAGAALTDQGFRLPGIDRVEIHHDAANAASGAVALRLGFTEVERAPAPDGAVAPGEVGIGVVWRITVGEWRERGTAA